MSHIIRLSPTIRQLPEHPQQTAGMQPVIIRDQSLFDDFVQLANLYEMAGLESEEMTINEIDSAVDAALSFFCYVEYKCFPLENMWDWDDYAFYYEETIRRWLTYIPVKVVGHDEELEPIYMSEPKALLSRLSQVGNYSDVANKHKQVLRCQYPNWEWGDLLDTFQLGQVTSELSEMFLPSPFDKLPALIKYMTHETGTYFLDYTASHWPHYIQWNKPNLDFLTDDWKTAKMIMDQSDALCHWLIENPSQLEKVWTILKVAHQRRSA